MYTVSVYCIDTPTKIEKLYNVDKNARMNHTESRIFLIENICHQYSEVKKSLVIRDKIGKNDYFTLELTSQLSNCPHARERLLDETRGTKRLRICLWVTNGI
jgi:hypothetical protein